MNKDKNIPKFEHKEKLTAVPGLISYLHFSDAFVSTRDTLIRLMFPNPTLSSGVSFPS